MSKKFELPGNLKSANKDEWRSLVDKALGGKSFDAALTSKTGDDITIQPLYAKGDAPEGLAVPAGTDSEVGDRPWQIIELIDIPDLKAANEQIRLGFDSGASGLSIAVNDDIPYGSAALPLNNVSDYRALFDGADLSGKSIYFSNGQTSIANAAAFLAYLQAEKIDPASVSGSFAFDPIGLYAATAIWPVNFIEAFEDWRDASAAIINNPTKMTPFMAAGRVWQQAGATEAMELALTLAAVLTYARALEESGLTIDQSFDAISASLTVTSDIFLSTAKLRAGRLMLAKIRKASGASDRPAHLLAEMSWLDMTRLDPEVNMLRATAATVAAGLGDADALVLLPFSAAHGVATKAARRLALNTQIIAQEESHIGAVTDPTAGSYYVDSLTATLAEKAWALLRRIEAKGGIKAALTTGMVDEMIRTARAEEVEAIATGRREITGTTVFPNLDEKKPDLMAVANTAENAPDNKETDKSQENAAGAIDLPAAGNGTQFTAMIEALKNSATITGLTNQIDPAVESTPLLADIDKRITDDIETLRTAAEKVTEKTGADPAVFLANLGRPSDFTARATWARSYFETGGIKAITNNGFDDQSEMIAAYKKSGASIACLCSTDDRYGEDAVTAAKNLKEAGAQAVYLVARPSFLKSVEESDQSAFHALLYKGNDMVEALTEALSIINRARKTTG